jgi:hypothetical protein
MPHFSRLPRAACVETWLFIQPHVVFPRHLPHAEFIHAHQQYRESGPRTVPGTERLSVRFRAELFNIFTPQLPAAQQQPDQPPVRLLDAGEQSWLRRRQWSVRLCTKLVGPARSNWRLNLNAEEPVCRAE